MDRSTEYDDDIQDFECSQMSLNYSPFGDGPLYPLNIKDVGINDLKVIILNHPHHGYLQHPDIIITNCISGDDQRNIQLNCRDCYILFQEEKENILKQLKRIDDGENVEYCFNMTDCVEARFECKKTAKIASPNVEINVSVSDDRQTSFTFSKEEYLLLTPYAL